MKKLKPFILSLLISGCFSGKQFKEGTYVYKGAYGDGYCEIQFHTDGTFIYSWSIGLDYGTTTGFWKHEKKYLLLNGGNCAPDQRIIVHEGYRRELDSIQIKVIDFDGVPLAAAGIKVNDSLTIRADMDGIAHLPRRSMKTIEISYLGVPIPIYEVKNSIANEFVISIYVQLDAEVCFDNAKVIVKRNKIIILSDPISIGHSVILRRLR